LRTVFPDMARLGFRLQGPVIPGHRAIYKNLLTQVSFFTFTLAIFFLLARSLASLVFLQNAF
jgi:hypothetical protein